MSFSCHFLLSIYLFLSLNFFFFWGGGGGDGANKNARIMVNAFASLKCSKKCWHNAQKPSPMTLKLLHHDDITCQEEGLAPTGGGGGGGMSE